MIRFSDQSLKRRHELNRKGVKERPPLVSIVGRSGSGKTTIMERLIPELKKRGLRVGSIKHHLHGFEIDYPGKDSWRHKQAGSEISIISSPHRIGMVMDVDHDHTFEELIPYFSGMDIVLSEGYKGKNRPKVEVFREEVHDRPLCFNDEDLIALISETDLDLGVPRFTSGDIEGLADFLIKHFRLKKG